MAGKQPLMEFFEAYAGFVFDPSASTTDEWRRLCRFCRWPTRKEDRNHIEREEAYEDFRRAMIQSFNVTFGSDDNDADAWGPFGSAAGFSNAPRSLEERKKVGLSSIHFNPTDVFRSCFPLTSISAICSILQMRGKQFESSAT